MRQNSYPTKELPNLNLCHRAGTKQARAKLQAPQGSRRHEAETEGSHGPAPVDGANINRFSGGDEPM
jgi:hypothetical protein